MRYDQSVLALLALPAATLAVSLSDFTPRVSDSALTTSCKNIYTSTIQGCSPSDFGSSSCSKGCVLGLQDLASSVQKACGGQGITGSNIIAAFLGGKGPSSLCTNAQQVLAGGQAHSTSAATTAESSSRTSKSASSTAPVTSSEVTSSSSSSDSSTTAPATTSSSAESTSSALPTTSTSSGILVDTSTQPETASATSSSEGSSQTDVNDNSGGGSPFDTQGNLASGAATMTGSIASALITTILALAVTLR